MVDHFPYQSELDEFLQSGILEESLTSRRQATDLTKIAREWIAALKEPDRALAKSTASSLVKKIEVIEAAVADLNRKTRDIWVTMLREPSCDRAGIRREIDRYTDYRPSSPGSEHYGPDELDLLVDCILRIGTGDKYSPSAGTELVHYEPAPARVVLEMIDAASIEKGQLFYDIGSGLGRVSFLVSILTGAESVGVEIDGRLVQRAEAMIEEAAPANRPAFLCADACEVDLSRASVLFLFSPFYGETLVRFIEKIADTCRGALVCSYGNCTPIIDTHPAYKTLHPGRVHPYKTALFAVGHLPRRTVFEK